MSSETIKDGIPIRDYIIDKVSEAYESAKDNINTALSVEGGISMAAQDRLIENITTLRNLAASPRIHTTVGVYPDGSYKVNGVLEDHLGLHIQYNTRYRGGRALFLNGIAIYRGSLDIDTLNNFEQRIKDNPEQFIKTVKSDKYE